MRTEDLSLYFRKFAQDNKLDEPTIISGDDLLKKNLNLIHAVGINFILGKGADNPPALVSFKYNGNKDSDEY